MLDYRSKAITMAILRAAVSGYLIYLGFTMIKDYVEGNSTLAPWLAWTCGMFFILGGAAFIWYSWKQYRAETKETPKESADNTVEKPPEAKE